MAHIFGCEKTRDYLEILSMNVGVQRVYCLKDLLRDHCSWSDHKKRNRICGIIVLKKKHGCRFKNGVEVRADGPISSSQGNYGGVKVTQVIQLQTLMETQRWNDQ